MIESTIPFQNKSDLPETKFTEDHHHRNDEDGAAVSVMSLIPAVRLEEEPESPLPVIEEALFDVRAESIDIPDEDKVEARKYIEPVYTNDHPPEKLDISSEDMNFEKKRDSSSTKQLDSSRSKRNLRSKFGSNKPTNGLPESEVMPVRSSSPTLFGGSDTLFKLSPVQWNESAVGLDDTSSHKLTSSVKFDRLDAMMSQTQTDEQESKKRENGGKSGSVNDTGIPKLSSASGMKASNCSFKGAKGAFSGATSHGQVDASCVSKVKTKQSSEKVSKKHNHLNKEKKNLKKTTYNSKPKVLSATPIQVGNPALNCYEWYNRLGRPSREDMKRRVTQLHVSCGVEPQHVDLLPWEDNGSSLKVGAIRDIMFGKSFSVQ